jgi:hypothetical protein
MARTIDYIEGKEENIKCQSRSHRSSLSDMFATLHCYTQLTRDGIRDKAISLHTVVGNTKVAFLNH